MARTVQKRIKFSKGQIAPELVERTDLELNNSSAQEMTNLISTVYGGFRTRRGTKYMSDIYSSTTTGTVTNNIGGTNSYIQDLTNRFDSSNIGNVRDLMTVDYGSLVVGGKFTVKNIRTDFLRLLRATSNTTYTTELDNLSIDCVGSKGNGTYGGKGGRVQCTLKKPAGTNLVLTVGGVPESGYIQSYNASDIRIGGTELRNRVIVAGGGGAGTGNSPNSSSSTNFGGAGGGLIGGTAGSTSFLAGGFGGTQGDGGAAAYATGGNADGWLGGAKGSFGMGGNGGSGYMYGGFIWAGAGGAGYYGGGGGSVYDINKVGISRAGGGGGSSYTNADCSNVVHTQGFQDGAGYIDIGVDSVKINIQTSTDNLTYTTVATYNIGKLPEDINVILSGFRYVKLVLDVKNTVFLTGKLHFDYIRLNSNISSKVKLIPYAFNNEQEYVIALLDKRVAVYEKGLFKQEIPAENLKAEYLSSIKYTSKDDVIILTHPDMKTLEIVRTNNGFVVKEFAFNNIPYHAFGGETKTEFTTKITPSGLEGAIKITASADLFDSSWVGQKIDGNGGVVRITEYVSKTVVNGVTIIPFYTTDGIDKWSRLSGYEKVWSASRGYPRTCLFAQQRLWFGGSRDLPAHLWASRLNDYNNFKNAGNYDNDAIDVTLLTNNAILNLVEQRGIHVFTSGEEWTASEASLTPDGFSIVKNTANGSKTLTPVIIGGVIMFVEKTGKSLLGYVYNYEQASFVADNLSIFSKLVNAPVAMAVETNSNVDRGDFLFVVLEDGTMLNACVALNENIFSISRFVTDGVIKDVCCLTSETYLAVDRGGGLYLERLSEDKTDQTQTFYVNGQIVYNMEEYNNKNIYVTYGDKTERLMVSDGQMKLREPYTGYATAGIAFDYKLQSNPIAIENRTFTCKKRISKATLVCKNTEKLTFCGQTKKNDYTFYACTKYDTDVRFEITGEYYPIEVLSLTLDINYEG